MCDWCLVLTVLVLAILRFGGDLWCCLLAAGLVLRVGGCWFCGCCLLWFVVLFG